jgi:hypothetical protein
MSQDNWYLGQDSNGALSDFRSRALTLRMSNLDGYTHSMLYSFGQSKLISHKSEDDSVCKRDGKVLPIEYSILEFCFLV